MPSLLRLIYCGFAAIVLKLNLLRSAQGGTSPAQAVSAATPNF
jgi:hypothetical protein